jgi:RES domain-containing protein
MIYTAENNLLAALEVALRVPLTNISSDYVMVPIVVPNRATVYSPELPRNWNHNSKVTRQVGNLFLEKNKYLLMKMPSALMNHTYNFLINPKHKSFKEVKAAKPHPLVFDDRLIKMMKQKNG